jgi:hypothetical protein
MSIASSGEPNSPHLQSDGSKAVSRERELNVLQERLIALVKEVSECDERIAQIGATRAKYQKLAKASPDDETLIDEVRGLGADLEHLFRNRARLAMERQAVRLEIQELTSTPQTTSAPMAQGGHHDLQARIEAIAKLRKRAGVSTPITQGRTELDFPTVEEPERIDKKFKPAAESDKAGLIRVRHPNRDFFLADMFDYALKDDGASMEAPIFTLSTKADLSVWRWVSKDGNRSVKVAPSVLGRATQHDKDVLIYVVSQLTEALNRGREDAQNRVVRFTVYDFLVTTNRGVGGDDYKRLQEAFERLAGTRISTDIKTGGRRVKEGFGIIDRWKIIEKSADDERMIAVEITMSEWLYNAVQAHEVLTIHPDYFRLRKPIARRMYELSRKHCGHQAQWQISLELLHEKSGSRGSIYEFHEALKAIAAEDSLPQYRVSLSKAGRVSEVRVTFYTRDTKRLANAVMAKLEP